MKHYANGVPFSRRLFWQLCTLANCSKNVEFLLFFRTKKSMICIIYIYNTFSSNGIVRRSTTTPTMINSFTKPNVYIVIIIRTLKPERQNVRQNFGNSLIFYWKQHTSLKFETLTECPGGTYASIFLIATANLTKKKATIFEIQINAAGWTFSQITKF